MAKYPVSNAQQQVLDALGVKHITLYSEAEEYFQRIGIRVSFERQGRRSVPVVTKLPDFWGEWGPDGEADSGKRKYEDVDLARLEKWMK